MSMFLSFSFYAKCVFWVVTKRFCVFR